jgi:hypothetical protein
MNDRERSSAQIPAPASRERRPYVTPTLVEYGTVAKLTQAGGSTSPEGTVPAKAMMCL